jgi:hypothetical protein
VALQSGDHLLFAQTENTAMLLLRQLALALLLGLGTLGLAACENGEGPAERAGETADDAAEDAGDAIEDATE